MIALIRRRFSAPIVCLGAYSVLVSNAFGCQKVSLDDVAIVIDAAQPSFVKYGTDELAGFLQYATGKQPSVVASDKKDAKVHILIGSRAAKDLPKESSAGGSGSFEIASKQARN